MFHLRIHPGLSRRAGRVGERSFGGLEKATHELWRLWQVYRLRAALQRVGGDADAADIGQAVNALLEGREARRRARDQVRRNGDELSRLLTTRLLRS